MNSIRYGDDEESTGSESEASVERSRGTSAERAHEAVYGALLAEKHPEESVDSYVERLASAARTGRRRLGPDGPLAPSPRTNDRVSAPSEYVTGTSDADWHYPIDDDERSPIDDDERSPTDDE